MGCLNNEEGNRTTNEIDGKVENAEPNEVIFSLELDNYSVFSYNKSLSGNLTMKNIKKDDIAISKYFTLGDNVQFNLRANKSHFFSNMKVFDIQEPEIIQISHNGTVQYRFDLCTYQFFNENASRIESFPNDKYEVFAIYRNIFISNTVQIIHE